ncbi:MAG: AAA family ATPase, partial [Acidobacteriota bacterium]|nr:AAA family ATPase [Acidobacteriota bacterium]
MAFLPIGIQTFRDIRTNDFVYVDKTERIHELVRPGKGYYLFSRPRRFGKSLLVSTLASLFDGDADLFEGLAIHKSGYAFPKHPVLSFDFARVPHDDELDLTRGLLDILDRMAEAHQVTLPPETSLPIRLQDLLRAVSKKGQVVILIDEYDKPIIEHIGDPDTADKCRDVLRKFFGVLKSSDAQIRMVFITGITRFARVSIFSEMNNLKDISHDKRYADLLGWTESEIDTYLVIDECNLSVTEEELGKKHQRGILRRVKTRKQFLEDPSHRIRFL